MITFTMEFKNRREFTKSTLMTVASVALVESLFGCARESTPAISETNVIMSPKPGAVLNHWAVSLSEYCKDLKINSLSVTEWQSKLSELFEAIELKELLQFIDFEKLSSRMDLPDLGVADKKFDFPRIAGMPENIAFVSKIFGLKRGRAIIPHGHSNMASGHLIVGGSFFLRQYDKMEIHGNRMKVRQTVEKQISESEFSSISDDRDNVHWFVAETEPAFTFDVVMLDLGGKPYEIHNLDMDKAEKLKGGELEVPVIGVRDALAKYGKDEATTAR